MLKLIVHEKNSSNSHHNVINSSVISYSYFMQDHGILPPTIPIKAGISAGPAEVVMHKMHAGK